MIMAESVPDIPSRARALIAHIARYHRGSLPDPGRHRSFGDLSSEERSLVALLAAVLRLADGLDRSHTNAVNDVDCHVEDDQLVIRLMPGQDDDDERWAAQKKSRFLAGLLHLRVVIC
jgi:exopolyphosphatase/guanosine-5'-triphosphate,3'-diphosphate pyrophosphatase